MSSELIELTEAVVDALNAETFSMPFIARRHYAPLFDLVDMKELHVSVVPRGVTLEQITRERAARDYRIDIAVQKKMVSGDEEELDSLIALTQEIAESFRGRRLASLPDAMWLKTEHTPIYSPEHLHELRQFTSVMILTFRLTSY